MAKQRLTAIKETKLRQLKMPRLYGTTLQNLRLELWTKAPFCNMCKAIVAYPGGFELDHVVALRNGGSNARDNLQILCPECHVEKTRQDMAISRM